MLIAPPRPIDHFFFHEIDTPQKAYLLGFLAADGCVSRKRETCSYRIDLKILTQDIKVCRMLYDLAGGSLLTMENDYRVCWSAGSNQIGQDLIALGITPRKTHTLAISWNRITPVLHGAVLAGMIDGDGHLRCTKKDRRVEISLVTISVRLKDQLLERFPFFKVQETPVTKGRNYPLFKLIVEQNRALLKDLIATVYANLPFAILDRKQRVLDEIRANLADQDAYDARMDQVADMKASGMTLQQIADHCGTTIRPVLSRLKAQGITSAPNVFTDEDRQRMTEMNAARHTIAEIHCAIGKGTNQAVRYQMQRLGLLQKTQRALPRHPYTDLVLELHHTGLIAQQIGDRLGMGRTLVCRVLRDAGIPLTAGSPQKLFPEQVIWAAGELAKGRTLRSVAEELGVSTTLVRIRLKELNTIDPTETD